MPITQFLVILNDFLLVVADKFLQFPLMLPVLIVVIPRLLLEFAHRLNSQPLYDFCEIGLLMRFLVVELVLEDSLVNLQSILVGLISLVSCNLLPSRPDVGNLP